MKHCRFVFALLLLPSFVAAAPVDPAGLVPGVVRRALLMPRAGAGATEAAQVLAVAGVRAPILRPQNLSRTLAQTVALEPFDPARLAAAGVDPEAPLVVAWFPGVEAAVAGVKDDAAARKALQAWLASIGGQPEERREKGAELHLHVSGKSAIAGWAIVKGRLYAARATEATGDVEAALRALLAAKGGKETLAAQPLWPAVRDAPGAVKLFARTVQDAPLFVSLAPDGAKGVAINGAAALPPGLPTPGEEPAGFPALELPGSLLTLRLTLPKDALAPGSPLRALTRTLASRACPACPPAAAEELATKLAPLLDGRALAVVSRLEVQALARAGRLDEAAIPHLWLFGVRDSKKVAALLEPFATKGRLAAGAAGWRAGSLVFGTEEGLLWVGNDPALVAELRPRALTAAGRAGAPLEVLLEPRELSRALAPLDLGDVFGGGTLAGLFAIKVELSGLFESAGPLKLSARATRGGILLNGRWQLQN